MRCIRTPHIKLRADAVVVSGKYLGLADTLFKRFSTNFYGKISPVHFFWGSFDLAVTRFDGRRAPARPGAEPSRQKLILTSASAPASGPGTVDTAKRPSIRMRRLFRTNSAKLS